MPTARAIAGGGFAHIAEHRFDEIRVSAIGGWQVRFVTGPLEHLAD